MPTYEYECTDCGTRLEVVQRMSEPALETCGACGGRLRKVFHPAGILFKGSGFYATDNRAKKKTAAAEGGASKEGSSKESSSKEGSSKEGSSASTKDTKKDGSSKAGGKKAATEPA